MFDHHDLLPFLPDIYDSGMGKEYDRDKTPHRTQTVDNSLIECGIPL